MTFITSSDDSVIWFKEEEQEEEEKEEGEEEARKKKKKMTQKSWPGLRTIRPDIAEKIHFKHILDGQRDRLKNLL